LAAATRGVSAASSRENPPTRAKSFLIWVAVVLATVPSLY
jgi:hypothetical protein